MVHLTNTCSQTNFDLQEHRANNVKSTITLDDQWSSPLTGIHHLNIMYCTNEERTTNNKQNKLLFSCRQPCHRIICYFIKLFVNVNAIICLSVHTRTEDPCYNHCISSPGSAIQSNLQIYRITTWSSMTGNKE